MMPIPDILRRLGDFVRTRESFTSFYNDVTIAPTGSRVICNPPVLDTDEDWLVYVPEPCENDASNWLMLHGARFNEQQKHYPDGIVMWLGNLNIIVISDYSIFYRWVVATYWAKQLGLNDKNDRLKYFQSTVDAVAPLGEYIL